MCPNIATSHQAAKKKKKPHTYTNRDTDKNADTSTDTNTDINTDTIADTNTDTNTDTNINTSTDTNTDANTYTNADQNTDENKRQQPNVTQYFLHKSYHNGVCQSPSHLLIWI